MLSAAASPAAADQWLKAESAHFIVYTDTGQSSARAYDRMLEDFDTVLRIVHGIPMTEAAQAKLKVYLVGDVADFKRAAPGLPPNTDGIYVASEQDTYVVAVRSELKGPRSYGDDTVLHEYAHHFMGQYAAMSYPYWYVEGFAEFFSTTDLGEKNIVVGRVSEGRAYQLARLPWISASALLNRNPMTMTEADRSAFYAQGGLLTHMIMDSPERRAAFIRFVDLCRHGQGAAPAWQAAFGQTLSDLEKSMRDYMSVNVMNLQLRRTWAEAPMQISKVPDGEGAVLLESQLLKQPTGEVDKVALFKTLRQAATRYPEDRTVRVSLAKAELAYGDASAGESILRQMLVNNGDDAEVLLTLGEWLAGVKESDPQKKLALQVEANQLFERIIKKDQNNYRALYAYALNRTFEREFPTQNTLNAMTRASMLAPQVAIIRVRAGQTAVWRKDYELARLLLGPVAGNPHAGGLSDVAIKLIATLPPEPAARPAAQ